MSFLCLALLSSLINLSHSSQLISSGDNYKLYYPFRGDWKSSSLPHARHPLLAPPKLWINNFQYQREYLENLVEFKNNDSHDLTPINLYLQTLENFIVGDYLGTYDRAVTQLLNQKQKKLLLSSVETTKREEGLDWPLFAMTMAGRVRLETIHTILKDIITNKVEGDIVETGVWRGGLSIYMRGVLMAYNESHRHSYICDSFAGLPESRLTGDEKTKWDNSPYLEISDDRVKGHFVLAGIIDPQIIFVKGFFTHTMKPLSLVVEKLSVIRLDGDMYESTVDVLYHLYEKLSIGGYAYIDDYNPAFPARDAVDDFIKVHKFSPTIITPDRISGYWKKTVEVKVQYWRYVEKKFKD
jgi:O-methyltransferase